MKAHYPLFTAMLLAVFLLAGCSTSVNSTNPLSPQIDTQKSLQVVSNQQLWGFYNVELNPDTMEFEIMPLRGAEFQTNVTRFLQPPIAPVNLLQLSLDMGASDLPTGLIVADITISHPFPGAMKFRGFDVMGIVMGDSSYSGPDTGDLFPSQDELRLLNADGYSRWWNPTEFTTFDTIFGYTQGGMAPAGYLASGTINGYRYFADDLDADDDITNLNLDNRGTFGVVPGINSRTYEIQFPFDGVKPNFKFSYAITASYFAPDNNDDPDYPLDVYPLSANLAEAFMIDIEDAGSSAFWENITTYGGDFKFDIEVYDWGLGETSTVSDEIAGIYAGGDVLGGYTWFPVDELDGEPGSSIYSYVFHMNFHDLNLTGLEGQEVIFGIRSVEPGTYEPDINGISGFAWPPDAFLTSYIIYEAQVSNVGPQENTPPEVGVIEGPTNVLQNEDTEYTLTFATDLQDGTNLTILWDCDGDMDFDDDLDGDDSDLHGTLNWSDEGFFNLIARAVDSEGLFTDTEPFIVFSEGCPDDVHGNFSSHTYSNSNGWDMITFETAWQVNGEQAGKCLIQNDASTVRAYDVTDTGTWGSEAYIDLGTPYNDDDFVWSIDVCDYSGRVILMVMNKLDVLDHTVYRVYDVNGNLLDTITVGEYREPVAIDTNDNGDLYIQTWENWHDDNENMSYDDGEGKTSQLEFWQYSDEAPYYTFVSEVDLTGHFEGNNLCWDIAVSYNLDRIYSLKGNHGPDMAPYGELYCWDIQPDGSLVFNELIQTQNAFTHTVGGAFTVYHGSLTYGDIEIDHSFEKTDGCRIVIMARSFEAGGFLFHVLDGDMNILGTSVSQGGYGFSIRPDNDPQERDMIVGKFQTNGNILMSPAPSGW